MPRRWLGLVLASGLALGCAGPAVELELTLSEPEVLRGDPLLGAVTLHNLSPDPVTVSAPGLPEIGLAVYRDGEPVWQNQPYLLNQIWERTLPPAGHHVHVDGTLAGEVDLAPGAYELEAYLWTHQHGTLVRRRPFRVR